MKLFAAILIMVICSVFMCFAQNGVTSFYGESRFVRPKELPKAVFELLRKDPEVRRCFSESRNGIYQNETFSANWFEATEINLKKGMRSGLLVKSEMICSSGNAMAFWAFEKEGRKYTKLFYTYTLSLDIRKETTNGRYNIATGRCTASACLNRIFGFNGTKYIQKREWWTPQP